MAAIEESCEPGTVERWLKHPMNIHEHPMTSYRSYDHPNDLQILEKIHQKRRDEVWKENDSPQLPTG